MKTSPEAQRYIDQWAQGYRPTEVARRHFLSQCWNEIEAESMRLATYFGKDPRVYLDKAREFVEQVARSEAALRRNLAGDRHPGPGSQPE
ncbi:hypothetical protein GV791_01785 [Nocardia cyriacigeorgica]|uniref:Uncharacterized protein n=1 Tax=Nocardia cyriacigeorgica TaxID=135487 RepID=A0A6P1CF88_9NOCA|nr:hypothetical protein [Nocardia cyriacigeorgica]MBF6288150.1 hypothetical protein [Nocardia cyriacigeorgica]NEW31291.1 hypothetical protein [Nocardia cyriacigeorgica]